MSDWQDRGFVWSMAGVGRPEATDLMTFVLAQQDTATLSAWKRDAGRLMEAIADEMEGRSGDANYPERGMTEA